MNRNGLTERDVLDELDFRLRKDITYQSGRIIGSMCANPNPFAARIYKRFLNRNLGDIGLYPGIAQLEKESIRMIGALLSNSRASGHILTGGTEANILSMYAAKKLSGKTNPEIIVPVSAHCSFDKSCDLLGMKIMKVGLDRGFRVDINAVEQAVSPNTVAIVGIAGTTGLGVVDPIDKLSEIASNHNLYLHVDAAFGGFVLPFLRELKVKIPRYDFEVPEICSITVDPHKMGMAPIPAGGLLFRNKKLRDTIAWKIPYLAGGEARQATFVGTRSGASVVATWTLLKHLGRSGYARVVEKCMKLTWKLADEIRLIEEVRLMAEPTMNIIGITSDRFDIQRMARRLRAKGWAVSLFPRHVRVVIMPHVKEEHIACFIKDLKKTVEELKQRRRTTCQVIHQRTS